MKSKESELVLIRDHTANMWDPGYTGDHRILFLPRKTQVDVVDSTSKASISDVKYILPTDWVISKLPEYQEFGRQSKLRIDPQHIPNLRWEPAVIINTNFLIVTLKLYTSTSITLSYKMPITIPTTSIFNLRSQLR